MCECALSHVQLFATLWTAAWQAPLFTGFSRQEDWSGLSFPTPGVLPHSGIEPASPALACGFFTTGATWETPVKKPTAAAAAVILKDISYKENVWPNSQKNETFILISQ